jgi:TPR repeat protein
MATHIIISTDRVINLNVRIDKASSSLKVFKSEDNGRVGRVIKVTYQAFSGSNPLTSNEIKFSAINDSGSHKDVLIKIKELASALGYSQEAIKDKIKNKRESDTLEFTILNLLKDKIEKEDNLELAKGGNADASAACAKMFYLGKGGEKDLKLTREHSQNAADLGHLSSQVNFSSMCYQGIGGSKNLVESRKYSKLSADQGCAESQDHQAWMCYHGEGGPVDFPEARINYERAAKQDLIESQFNYAEMCEDGKGGPVDLKEAIKYYKLAANKEDKEAQKAFERLETKSKKRKGAPALS